MKWILIFFLIFCSCREDRQSLVDRIIQMRIESRIQDFRKQEFKKCHERIFEEAVQIVDSLLRENPILLPIDTLNRPPKPQKPHEPVLVVPKDTIPLKPLIN